MKYSKLKIKVLLSSIWFKSGDLKKKKLNWGSLESFKQKHWLVGLQAQSTGLKFLYLHFQYGTLKFYLRKGWIKSRMFPLRVEKLQTKAGQKAKVKISRTQSMVKQSEKQNSGMKKLTVKIQS